MWSEKYKPKTIAEMVGQEKAKLEAESWLKNYRGKGFLAYGPPGTGKTLLAELIAKEKGWELIEMNASDLRNKDAVEGRLLNAGRQASLFGKGKLILVDEVDGIIGRKDRGAASAISDLIKTSFFPVYLTCNDNWANSVRAIRTYVKEVKFEKPRTSQVTSFLEKIAEKENIGVDKGTLLQLAGERDWRSAILDFEAYAKSGELEGLGDRDRLKTVFEVVRDIFKATSAKQAKSAFENSDSDIDTVMLWLEENIPNEYEGRDIAEAYDALSRADTFKGRIMKRQDWSLLKYVIGLSTMGVAMAKREVYRKFTPYRPPLFLMMMGRSRVKRAMRKNVFEKIGQVTHTSRKGAKEYVLLAKQFPELFGLDKEEAKLL